MAEDRATGLAEATPGSQPRLQGLVTISKLQLPPREVFGCIGCMSRKSFFCIQKRTPRRVNVEKSQGRGDTALLTEKDSGQDDPKNTNQAELELDSTKKQKRSCLREKRTFRSRMKKLYSAVCFLTDLPGGSQEPCCFVFTVSPFRDEAQIDALL